MNAAKHAGVTTVSVYAEVEPDQVTAFVRDQGRGFDPASVDGDRRGITESILGRMERAGGTGSVESSPGEVCAADSFTATVTDRRTGSSSRRPASRRGAP